MNKRQLYENIMRNVSREVKKALNESYDELFDENNWKNIPVNDDCVGTCDCEDFCDEDEDVDENSNTYLKTLKQHAKYPFIYKAECYSPCVMTLGGSIDDLDMFSRIVECYGKISPKIIILDGCDCPNRNCTESEGFFIEGSEDYERYSDFQECIEKVNIPDNLQNIVKNLLNKYYLINPDDFYCRGDVLYFVLY